MKTPTIPNIAAAIPGTDDPILADDLLLKPAAASPLLGRSVSTMAKDRMAGTGCPWVKQGRFALYRYGTIKTHIASRVRRSTSEASAIEQRAQSGTADHSNPIDRTNIKISGGAS